MLTHTTDSVVINYKIGRPNGGKRERESSHHDGFSLFTSTLPTSKALIQTTLHFSGAVVRQTHSCTERTTYTAKGSPNSNYVIAILRI